MAIFGDITLEDTRIIFEQNQKDNTINFRVYDYPSRTSEHFRDIPQDKFFKALSIAIHNDGMPDAVRDYPDAESIMGKIRWIP